MAGVCCFGHRGRSREERTRSEQPTRPEQGAIDRLKKNRVKGGGETRIESTTRRARKEAAERSKKEFEQHVQAAQARALEQKHSMTC